MKDRNADQGQSKENEIDWNIEQRPLRIWKGSCGGNAECYSSLI